MDDKEQKNKLDQIVSLLGVLAQEAESKNLKKDTDRQDFASNITNIKTLLEDANKKWVEDRKAIDESNKILTTAGEKIKQLEEEVSKLRDQASELQKKEVLANRLSTLVEKYDIPEKQKSIVAKRIYGLSDEEFEDYQVEFEIFASHLKRTGEAAGKKKEVEESESEKLDQASIEKDKTVDTVNGGNKSDVQKLVDSIDLTKVFQEQTFNTELINA